LHSISSDITLWRWMFTNHWGIAAPPPQGYTYLQLHKKLQEISLCLDHQKRHCVVLFEQDGRIIFPEPGHNEVNDTHNFGDNVRRDDEKEVTLFRSPWKLMFLFSRKNLKWLKKTDFGVYMNISLEMSDEFHVSAYITGRADEDIYGENCVLLSPYCGVLYYYELKEDHTFTTVDKTDQFFVCKKNVNKCVYYGGTSTPDSMLVDENFSFDVLYMMVGERALSVTEDTCKKWINGQHITIHFK